jgi:hypothetical protein
MTSGVVKIANKESKIEQYVMVCGGECFSIIQPDPAEENGKSKKGSKINDIDVEELLEGRKTKKGYAQLRSSAFGNTPEGIPFYPPELSEVEKRPNTVFILGLDKKNKVLSGAVLYVHEPGDTGDWDRLPMESYAIDHPLPPNQATHEGDPDYHRDYYHVESLLHDGDERDGPLLGVEKLFDALSSDERARMRYGQIAGVAAGVKHKGLGQEVQRQLFDLIRNGDIPLKFAVGLFRPGNVHPAMRASCAAFDLDLYPSEAEKLPEYAGMIREDRCLYKPTDHKPDPEKYPDLFSVPMIFSGDPDIVARMISMYQNKIGTPPDVVLAEHEPEKIVRPGRERPDKPRGEIAV